MDFWIYILVAFAVFLLLFLALRWFFLWYWRMNDVVDRLDGIRADLRELNTTLMRQQRAAAPVPEPLMREAAPAAFSPPSAIPDATLKPSPRAQERQGS